MNDTLSEDPEYAGFLVRFFAFLIDWVIVLSASGVVFACFAYISTSILDADGFISDEELRFMQLIDNRIVIIIHLLKLFVSWLYHGLLESSSKQATFGKIVLGLKVVNHEGNRISFGRATGRFIVKNIPFTLPISAVRIIIDKKIQTLHDFAARTYVVESN